MILVSAEYHRTTGLGNKLFPWSRAKIFASEKGCHMVNPIWFAPRGAAIIRGGVKYKDLLKRFWLLRNFTADPANISPITYYLKYRTLHKQFLDNLQGVEKISGDNKHYIFRAIASHNFADLQPYRSFIFENLEAITDPAQKAFVNQYKNKEYIGLHIRTGKDFVSKSSGKEGFYLTEIEWFIHALGEARKSYGNLPAFVVSDGGEAQLAAILKEPKVSLVNSKTAIADILVLSYSNVLLGSGNSSFSAWASFLGEMDTFSSPETPYTKFKINSDHQQKISTL